MNLKLLQRGQLWLVANDVETLGIFDSIAMAERFMDSVDYKFYSEPMQ